MSDQDVAFAKAAFGEALPEVEYRANAVRAPRPRGAVRAGALAGVAVVAAAAVFALTTTTSTSPAWSATPNTLTSAQTDSLDSQCRAAKSEIVVVGNGTQSGPGGVTVSGGDVSTSGQVATTPGGQNETVISQTVGNLPLILIDSRGAMSLALYGDGTHTVMCTLGPDGKPQISPDMGVMAAPTGNALVASAAGAVMGTVNVSGDPSQAATGTTRLLGRVAPNVTSMVVEVPGVGSVTATVKDGYYSLFIPDALIGSNGSSGGQGWSAQVGLSDGSTQHVTLPGTEVGPAGNQPIPVQN